MINLLPPEIKSSYRYARRNLHLYHWVLALGFALVGALIITAVGFVYLHQSTTSYRKDVAVSRENLKKQNFDDVQKQVKDASNNIKLATQVLSKQVLFSELLNRLSSLLPRDTVLTSLAISQAQNGLDITAEAKSYDAAAQLQVNLADPKNNIFSDADIVTISCPDKPSNPDYPCSVTIRAQFLKDNPFLFVSNTGAKS